MRQNPPRLRFTPMNPDSNSSRPVVPTGRLPRNVPTWSVTPCLAKIPVTRARPPRGGRTRSGRSETEKPVHAATRRAGQIGLPRGGIQIRPPRECQTTIELDQTGRGAVMQGVVRHQHKGRVAAVQGVVGCRRNEERDPGARGDGVQGNEVSA
jgi:hypothetical protein